jgi:hypothetical protein
MNGNKKSRKNNTTKKNQLNIPIKNTDIYTLITNRLKNKKSQDDSTTNDPFKQTKDPIINIKNDIEYVQQMLQNTKSKKNIHNKTRKSFSYNVDSEVPWGNMKNGLKKTFREWKKTSNPVPQINKTSPTIQFSPNLLHSPIPSPISSPIQQHRQIPPPPQVYQQQSSVLPLPPPQVYQQQLPVLPLPPPPPIYPQQSLLPVPIISQSYNYQPQEIIQKQELSPIQMVPVKINKKIKKTIHNKYKLGKQKNRQIPRVGILLKTPNTRKTIIEECKKLKSEDISQIKTYLRKRGFIKEGSIAPPNVIRELYCSLKTTGDVKNTNKEYTMDDLHSADN